MSAVTRAALLGLTVFLPIAARAAEPVRLMLKDNRFNPSEVQVPAGERFQIEVTNQGSKPAEFESKDLRIEKVVVPGGKIIVTAGPLKPGTYKFFDEYAPEATGTVVVLPAPGR